MQNVFKGATYSVDNAIVYSDYSKTCQCSPHLVKQCLHKVPIISGEKSIIERYRLKNFKGK